MGTERAIGGPFHADLNFSRPPARSQPVLSRDRLNEAIAAPRQPRGNARKNVGDPFKVGGICRAAVCRKLTDGAIARRDLARFEPAKSDSRSYQFG